MTLRKQNKTVVISHKTCQLHWRAAGLIVGRSKLCTESLATRLLKYSLPEVTQSGMLEVKPNCTKIFVKRSILVFYIGKV